MKAIASLLVCLALSACATDYSSQLSQPDFGRRGLHYSEGNVDPMFWMNGTYASKQLYGPQACTSANCSRQVPFWAQGWAP